MASLRIVIVDGHAGVRASTRALLAEVPDLTVVGEASSGQEALGLARTLRPDVVLLDLVLSDGRGIAVARALRAAVPATQVVVLTGYDDAAYVDAARAMGVAAYLLKTAPGHDVIAALHRLGPGQVRQHPAVAE